MSFKNVGGREYYQVCLSMNNESTAEREMSALRSIDDNFPKTILTLDPVVKHVNKDGLIIMSVIDWLLDDGMIAGTFDIESGSWIEAI